MRERTFIRLFVRALNSSIHSVIQSFGHFVIHCFIHSLVHAFLRLFVHLHLPSQKIFIFMARSTVPEES